jgi:hypothetical protein
LECQTRFAAATWAGDDGQFSQRKIDVDRFEIVLACAANLDAIIPHRSENALSFPDLRTHWKPFQIATRFANSGERTLATVLVAAKTPCMKIRPMECLKSVRCAISVANSSQRKTGA